MVVGGPTTVLDLGGLRVVSDPTFDDPGPHGYLTKTAGPAVPEDQLGPVDLVLASHDNHPDNQNSASSYHLRSPEQIGAFFDGLTLAPPGLVPASRWPADGAGAEDDDTIVGVGRKA